MSILTREEINKQINNWEMEDDKIEKTFEFDDFKQAMGFVNKVADLSETNNHHPEIEILYNKVEIELSTHSEGGVTEKDINLAKQIDLL